MQKAYYLLLALCVVLTVQSFIWSNQLLSVSRAKTHLSMARGALQRVKDRYLGRGDIVFVDQEVGSKLENAMNTAVASAAQPPSVGETVTGSILEVDDTGAWVSIGGKMSAFLPVKEVSLDEEKDMRTRFEAGQSVTAEVVGTLKGMPVLSLRTGQLVAAWDKVLAIKEKDETFDVQILDVNKGGAVCNVFGLKGFLPGSHFLGIPDERLVGTFIAVS